MRRMDEMPYHIGLKVKIYPSRTQKKIIAVNDGVRRCVYNHLVACGNEKYRLAKSADAVPVYRERISYIDSVSKTASGIKNAFPFLYGGDVDEQSIHNAIKNYRTAWKNMKENHTGIPVFKKKSSVLSYQTNAHYYKNGGSNVRFEDRHHVTLPKLGRIRMAGSPKLIDSLISRTADTRIGTITIMRDAVSEYWVSFSIASEEPFRDTLPKTGSIHGIDLNLISLVDDSDGCSYDNMKFYRRSQRRLRKAQHTLSRRGEHAKAAGRNLRQCKNYQEQRRKTAYINRKTERQRRDYLHNISKREVENQDFIAAEDLKVKNLMRNHKLAKSIADAGWGTLLTMLSYKADMYGKTFVKVPPHNTTQTCSKCGHVMRNAEKLTLSDREWTCPVCKTFHYRDTNAAINILNRALEMHGLL